jgi:hypothetical protein
LIKCILFLFGCMSLDFITRVSFSLISNKPSLTRTCLLGFVWGVVAGSEQL